ncbi:hypothetical protein PCANC_03129 [Puccinia coronata f. sp. avenae]|uniref:Manganese/iron superoxide dismutase C-terminal domain-containing protein n=1 Tax=Puccinia coronata f. sp. avenae TaxID=200324 RepID=A0A2N5W4L8_9BASI|nr:hypothetical protein PCANC_25897 [Puccinia coronata f. sp. avenae]PLW57175.1 hypothetical protein PCANC_03129 [Puccinia coronata f. sp. avenae]
MSSSSHFEPSLAVAKSWKMVAITSAFNVMNEITIHKAEEYIKRTEGFLSQHLSCCNPDTMLYVFAGSFIVVLIGIAEQHQQQRIAELEQLLERITAHLEAYHEQLIAVLEAQNKQLIAVLEAQNKQRIAAEARNEQHFTILKDHLHILQAAFAKERTRSITPILADQNNKQFIQRKCNIRLGLTHQTTRKTQNCTNNWTKWRKLVQHTQSTPTASHPTSRPSQKPQPQAAKPLWEASAESEYPVTAASAHGNASWAAGGQRGRRRVGQVAGAGVGRLICVLGAHQTTLFVNAHWVWNANGAVGHRARATRPQVPTKVVRISYLVLSVLHWCTPASSPSYYSKQPLPYQLPQLADSSFASPTPPPHPTRQSASLLPNRAITRKNTNPAERFNHLHPLMAIAVAERAYLPNHGVWGKESYLRNYWKCVNWAKVEQAFLHYGGSGGHDNLFPRDGGRDGSIKHSPRAEPEHPSGENPDMGTIICPGPHC